MTTTLGPALALGITYALIGAAVSVVAVTARTLHLAVGQVLVAGVLVALVLGSSAVGLPLVAVVPVALLVGAGVSALLGPLVLDRLPGGLTWLLGLAVAAAVLEAVLARSVTATVFRPEPLVAVPPMLGLDAEALAAVAVGLPAVALLAIALDHTRWGVRLRLVGGSIEAAERGGISPAVVRAQALGVGGAAAVGAGRRAAPRAGAPPRPGRGAPPRGGAPGGGGRPTPQCSETSRPAWATRSTGPGPGRPRASSGRRCRRGRSTCAT
jgi:branched-chain amino acid transport system permease protein